MSLDDTLARVLADLVAEGRADLHKAVSSFYTIDACDAFRVRLSERAAMTGDAMMAIKRQQDIIAARKDQPRRVSR
jgi:hypothetical protein